MEPVSHALLLVLSVAAGIHVAAIVRQLVATR